MSLMAIPENFREHIRPLQRVEYDRMVDLGLLEGEKVELLKGFIVRMSPTGVPHASVVQFLNQRLILALVASGRAAIRIQAPLAASDDSEPEPDVAILAPRDYRDEHPKTAFLVIEVAESSLRRDRGEKAEIYAAAGVEEYWVVDTRHELVEVRTDIVDGLYTRVTPYRRGQTLAPRAFPDVVLKVDEILG
jgi:Uma2 family endonuclease